MLSHRANLFSLCDSDGPRTHIYSTYFLQQPKKRLPAVRLHFTWYRFCTVLIIFFHAFARLLITLALNHLFCSF